MEFLTLICLESVMRFNTTLCPEKKRPPPLEKKL